LIVNKLYATRNEDIKKMYKFPKKVIIMKTNFLY